MSSLGRHGGELPGHRSGDGGGGRGAVEQVAGQVVLDAVSYRLVVCAVVDVVTGRHSVRQRGDEGGDRRSGAGGLGVGESRRGSPGCAHRVDMLADIKTRIEVGRYFAWKAADHFDKTGGMDRELSNMVKIYNSELSVQAVYDAMRLVGVDFYGDRTKIGTIMQDVLCFPRLRRRQHGRPPSPPARDAAQPDRPPGRGRKPQLGRGLSIRAARSDTQRRGPGRPPLPEFTLTEPKTVPFAPGRQAEMVSLLTDMIIRYLREQRLEQARAAAAPTDAYPPTEPPGHSPAP